MPRPTKSTTVMHPYFIPKPYYQPAMLALSLFRSQGVPFNQSIDIAYSSFRSSSISRNSLSHHVLKWIANN